MDLKHLLCAMTMLGWKKINEQIYYKYIENNKFTLVCRDSGVLVITNIHNWINKPNSYISYEKAWSLIQTNFKS